MLTRCPQLEVLKSDALEGLLEGDTDGDAQAQALREEVEALNRVRRAAAACAACCCCVLCVLLGQVERFVWAGADGVANGSNAAQGRDGRG